MYEKEIWLREINRQMCRFGGRLEIRGQAFDLPVAITRRVEPAAAGDFLRWRGLFLVGPGPAHGSLGERALGGGRQGPARRLAGVFTLVCGGRRRRRCLVSWHRV